MNPSTATADECSSAKKARLVMKVLAELMADETEEPASPTASDDEGEMAWEEEMAWNDWMDKHEEELLPLFEKPSVFAAELTVKWPTHIKETYSAAMEAVETWRQAVQTMQGLKLEAPMDQARDLFIELMNKLVELCFPVIATKGIFDGDADVVDVDADFFVGGITDFEKLFAVSVYHKYCKTPSRLEAFWKDMSSITTSVLDGFSTDESLFGEKQKLTEAFIDNIFVPAENIAVEFKTCFSYLFDKYKKSVEAK